MLTLLRCTSSMKLNTDFQQKPAHIIIHLPWFVLVKSATVDGKPVDVDQQSLSIPASSLREEIYRL